MVTNWSDFFSIKIKIIFINWSMYWCWFWTDVAPSACIFVTTDTFWPNYLFKWYLWTKCSIHIYNVTNLNLIMIEIRISSPLRYHESTIIIIYNVFCIWKIKVVSIIIPNNTCVLIFIKLFHVKNIRCLNKCRQLFYCFCWIKYCYKWISLSQHFISAIVYIYISVT